MAAMNAMKGLLLAPVLFQGVQSAQVREGASAASAGNPIRKVVTMLQAIKKKVEAEGEAEEKLFEKFMCYCKNSGGDLQAGIDANTAKIPEVQSAIEEAQAEKAQLVEDLAKHRADRESAKAAMAEATSIRQKEAATFAAYKAEQESNMDAVKKAVASLESGMAGFLQTDAAVKVKNLVNADESMLDADREEVMSFLTATSTSDYAPQSGEITGMLKQLGDRMAADLADATKVENDAIKSYDGLMAAKTKEVDANTAAIEEKTIREGEVSVNIVNMKNELSDAQKALAEDTKFLADMEKNCATKQSEWDTIKATRAEELVALSDTIKMLNDDDALELFKKTLPSAASSFMQVQVSSAAMAKRALEVIKSAKSPQLNFIALALHGKQMGFAKVLAMIDDMVGVLQKEQKDDNNKKEYCETAFDSLDDKKKALERDISDSEKAIADSNEAIETLTAEIEALDKAIKALDKSVAEATEQRKQENEDYTSLMTQNTAAKELIGLAKNRLNKFYNPKMYKAPPKRELSEQDRIAVSMGGTAPPTPAPGGIAGTGISALVQTVTAPPAAPDAPGAFKKKGEEATGVIGMMDLLAADLDKEMTVATQEEKDAQADYEQMLSDSASKRAQDMQSLSDKGAAKADTEKALQDHTDDHTQASKEHLATKQVIAATHVECDFLLENYSMRKEARNGEIDSLKKAKAVLSGADYSLLQRSARSLRGHA